MVPTAANENNNQTYLRSLNMTLLFTPAACVPIENCA